MGKTVKFTAQKAVQQATVVKFRTKDGQSVTFKATEIVKKPTEVRFTAKTKRK